MCLSTKALKVYVALDAFVADYGDPLICHSDRGSQLLSAAKQNPDLELPDYDLDLVASSVKVKTGHYTTSSRTGGWGYWRWRQL